MLVIIYMNNGSKWLVLLVLLVNYEQFYWLVRMSVDRVRYESLDAECIPENNDCCFINFLAVISAGRLDG